LLFLLLSLSTCFNALGRRKLITPRPIVALVSSHSICSLFPLTHPFRWAVWKFAPYCPPCATSSPVFFFGVYMNLHFFVPSLSLFVEKPDFGPCRAVISLRGFFFFLLMASDFPHLLVHFTPIWCSKLSLRFFPFTLWLAVFPISLRNSLLSFPFLSPLPPPFFSLYLSQIPPPYWFIHVVEYQIMQRGGGFNVL